MYQDPEINALSNVNEALKGLNRDAIKRIVEWVGSKFGVQKPEEKAVKAEVTEVTEPPLPAMPEPVVPVEPFVPAEQETGIEPVEVKPVEIKEDFGPLSTVVSMKITGLMKYDSLDEMFDAVELKKGTEKILLAASFLQENKNFKELTSYEISSALKNVGISIKHVSGLINSLMTRKPPLFVQVGTFGASKQSRRKFRVTEEGLQIARSYIK